MPLPFHLIYIISGFMTLAIGLGFYLKQPNRPLVKLFSALALAAAAWVISLYLFYTMYDQVGVLMVGRVNWAFSELIVTFLFFFAYLFPKKSYAIPRWLLVAVAVESALLVAVTFATPLIDENETIRGTSRLTAYGPMFWLFIAHFVGLTAGTTAIFIQKYRRFNGIVREQVVNMALTCVSALVVGAVTNIFIPMLTGWYDIQHAGPLAVLVFIAGTTYAMAKNELFNMKILGAEVIVAFVILVLIANTIIMPDAQFQLISLFVLVVTLVMSALLIINVHREARALEQLDGANRELATANSQLKEMDNIKNEFITMASHQLRTPISVVKGYLSLMQEGAYGAVPESFKDKLAQMYSLNERLVQMIDNMLNVARIEKRKIEYSIVRADILPAVHESVETMKLKAAAKNLTINIHTPDQPVIAYLDEEKFQEVLGNLIDNAIKYTDKGGIEVNVVEDDGNGNAMVTVKDSGIGMTPEEAGRAFTKFFRAKEAVIREPGTGLGLFICAKLMSGMDGQVAVEKTGVGEGTTFSVRLPIRQRDGISI